MVFTVLFEGRAMWHQKPVAGPERPGCFGVQVFGPACVQVMRARGGAWGATKHVSGIPYG